jgi:GT2 family glycosyltransferase
MQAEHIVDLDVIIPTYNRQQEVHKTLEMLLGQEVRPRNVIVVNQTLGVVCAHPDISSTYAESGTQLVWINRIEPNLCGARNAGLVASSSSVCLFLDDDVLLPKALVRNHWEKFQQHEDIAAIGGQVYHRTYAASLAELSLSNPHLGTRTAFAAEAPLYGGPLFGGHFSVRRRVAIEIGGWDEAFVGSANWEEGDFMHRLHNKGYVFLWDPELWLIHYRSAGGGCRIPNNAHFPEWTKTANFFLFGYRYPLDKSWITVWKSALRAGPCRKEVIMHPSMWICAWSSLVQGWREGYKRAHCPVLPLATARV